ncbi:MAG TPA: hypothetical protein VNF24_09900, partial [Candidatus Acidoferrales bacterium]|nr:hypothetical protein [Candidatus Acidoferrales bacterium]
SARQNVAATIIVSVLVLLSLILTVTTVFPQLPLGPFTLTVTVLGGAGLLWMGVMARRRRGRDPERERAVTGDRQVWRMPPLSSLKPPVWSRGQRIGMLALRGYLVLAVVLLAVKIAQLAVAR